jgi:hypothetical protein
MQIREKQETLSLMLDFLPDQWSFGIPLLNRKPVSKISGKTVGIYILSIIYLLTSFSQTKLINWSVLI